VTEFPTEQKRRSLENWSTLTSFPPGALHARGGNPLLQKQTLDMPHASKRKGNRYEREIVEAAEAAGLEAERAFASDGRSLGETEATDVLIRHPEANVSDCTRLQCKRRANVAQYLQCDDADVTVIREDYGESLAVVPLGVFLDLLTN